VVTRDNTLVILENTVLEQANTILYKYRIILWYCKRAKIMRNRLFNSYNFLLKWFAKKAVSSVYFISTKEAG
jgi:hypothetical protein